MHTLQSDTLKKRLDAQRKEIKDRLFEESRLLFAAFEERGRYKYRDHVARELFGTDSGKPFIDSFPPEGSAVNEVIVHTMDGHVVGLQLKWQTPGLPDWASPMRGSSGGRRRRFGLKSKSGERLAAIEGYAGRYVSRLRFYTTSGNRSPWYGTDESGSRFVLGSIHSRSNTFICGLHGRGTNSVVSALGILVRRITETNVFSECWKSSLGYRVNIAKPSLPGEDASAQNKDKDDKDSNPEDILTGEERQFATLLRMRR